MYFIINFFLQNLVNLYCAVSVAFCLTPKYPRLRSILIYTLTGGVFLLLKFFNFDNQVILSISSFCIQFAFLLFALIAFQDSIYKKLIVSTVIILCSIMSELLCLIFLDSIASYTMALEPHSKEFTIAILFILPVQFLFNLMFIFIWNHTIRKKKSTILLIFSLLPMVQLIISASVFAPVLIDENMRSNSLMFICSLIAAVTIVILLYIIMRRQEKQSIQAAYLELQELYQLETEYYQSLEARHEELAKIRHDYNNQLSTLYMLISSNQTEAAKELAASLKKYFES